MTSPFLFFFNSSIVQSRQGLSNGRQHWEWWSVRIKTGLWCFPCQRRCWRNRRATAQFSAQKTVKQNFVFQISLFFLFFLALFPSFTQWFNWLRNVISDVLVNLIILWKRLQACFKCWIDDCFWHMIYGKVWTTHGLVSGVLVLIFSQMY